jgi:hypothetical protein
MSEKNLRICDAASAITLLAWLGIAVAHLIFRPAISIVHADIAAWCAFGAAMLLSGLPRWLNEISDAEAIGPFRLWGFAGIAALVFCVASSFIATPKIAELKARATSPTADHEALAREQSKTQNFSMQFLCIRAALALGMALGARKLPFGPRE